ncbi:constitutive coactivator of peroxisome proliferator-activated receptor gamma isoform X2 [Dipodomys spectabilis]|uniref:constitutive coactivator of peroxisome proliferator-activated receptor gamma isoform X2 n=1 Tax=Dipodomys spectabilis TaxID=105255 RepID=UPI001C54B834|nr:constitutive coactivator of peroxisome proliferator-activated receptor gamma isoform X2 [Dipodomys spectabilis]XP_042523672.1 constitutive coactivator of peroxisome proliferator-activated receptor gamma isoform X2 [Dipodomys spectabilis]
MGVRGLQGFVGSSCPHVCTVVNFRELSEHHRSTYPGCTPTIVVDAMCCLRYWYTPESWICGGQWREYFSALRDFVQTFTDVGIKLVFFFDGMVEKGKRDEWVKRRLKNNREISRIFQHIKSHREQPGRNMFFIPSGLAIFTRFALKTLGQETLCSLQEADYEVASYGRQHNCLGILGEDTDYLIYDTCPYFSISELCLESLSTVMLCREKLCESLGLQVSDLPLLACLLGNDVVPEGMFESFRYKCLSFYTSVKGNFDKKGSVILAVSDHISKVLHLYQGEKKLEEMLPLGPNKALFYKGVASYLLPGQKSPWLFQKPKGVIMEKQTIAINSEVSLYTDSDSKPEAPMCTDSDSKQEGHMHTDPDSKQEVLMRTDPDSKQEVPLYTHSEIKHKLSVGADPELNPEAPENKEEDLMNAEAEIKQELTMVSNPEILKVARMHHVHAESYLVYNIMSSGEIECSNTLEDELDQALPSQAFIYRPVRQRVYSLLLGDSKDGASTDPVVKEWFVYPGNPLKHPDLVRPLPMTVPGGTPSLEVLWLNLEPAAQNQRLDTLLACFNLSSSREELQTVESPLRALCCLLIYLFVQVDTLCLEDLHAFIAQALCLQGKSTAQLANLQLDYISPRAVQLGSLFIRGLTTLVLVNSACGFPWTMSAFMPWNVFDGKLFHLKYLQSEKGYAVEVLLEQNRSWLTRFQNLKAVVCKACGRENRRIVGKSHWTSHHTGSRQYEYDHWRRY